MYTTEFAVPVLTEAVSKVSVHFWQVQWLP